MLQSSERSRLQRASVALRTPQSEAMGAALRGSTPNAEYLGGRLRPGLQCKQRGLKMKYRYLMIGLLLSGCITANEPQGPRMTDAEAFAKAKQLVIAGAREPESLRFAPSMSRRQTTGMFGGYDIVCGAVNGKNGFGGYTGMKQFVYRITDDKLLIDGDGTSPDPAYRNMASMWCA
jgi:hypothetical protein